jgi:ParB family chromosome partitioning protein
MTKKKDLEKSKDKKTKTAFDGHRGTVFYLDPDNLLIIEDKDHALYDPRIEKPLSEPFVRSIMARGVLEPVIVRKNGEQPEVVDGRQRVRGAREANRRLRAEGASPVSIPILLWRGDDGAAFETAIVLNEQREDDTPLARAKKANILLQRGRSDSDVAEIFGVSTVTIRAWVELLDLHPKVQAAVEQGQISASNAVSKLGTLPREKQIEVLTELGAHGNNGVSVRKAVEKAGGKAGAKPLPGKKQLRKLVDIDRENDDRTIFSKREIALLSWITGDISEGRVGEAIPGFLPLLHRAERARVKAQKQAEAEAVEAE